MSEAAIRQAAEMRELREQLRALKEGGGNGTSGGMEARIAKLEAQMEHVRAELGKLASVPADIATVKERMTHLPTKADMKTDIENAVDKSGARVQRTVAISAGLVTIILAAMNYLPRLLGH
jgi:preprotein translocase subunit YajC